MLRPIETVLRAKRSETHKKLPRAGQLIIMAGRE
jgi:hypothetical protein